MEDISFRLKPGETLGVIGATGCGKSTLMALLMRLYDADAGLIQIGGRNITSIPWRSSTGVWRGVPKRRGLCRQHL